MKELCIEEKAKTYDEIIKKANKLHSENCEACQICIEELIPELKEESEDERIRKALITYFSDEDESYDGIPYPSILAWLEKQSKASKVEQAMREVEEKAEAFTEAHKGETSEEILAQMRGEQKPAWSEKDEYYYGIIQYILNNECVGNTDKEEAINWFKSLKERVQPKQEWGTIDEKVATESIDMYESEVKDLEDIKTKQEWSEDDEIMFRKVIITIDNARMNTGSSEYYQGICNWLLSLKERYTWKPSERQKEALLWCVVHLGGADKQVLGELLEELNKL